LNRYCRQLVLADMWIGRTVQPQMLAQRLAFVFLAEDAAPLQLRHHQVDEVHKAGGQEGRYNIETIGALFDEPLLDQVRHCLHRAHRLHMAARHAELEHQLADREVLPARQIQLLLEAALAVLAGLVGQIRQGAVDVIARQVKAAKLQVLEVNA